MLEGACAASDNQWHRGDRDRTCSACGVDFDCVYMATARELTQRIVWGMGSIVRIEARVGAAEFYPETWG